MDGLWCKHQRIHETDLYMWCECANDHMECYYWGYNEEHLCPEYDDVNDD